MVAEAEPAPPNTAHLTQSSEHLIMKLDCIMRFELCRVFNHFTRQVVKIHMHADLKMF